MKTEIFKVTENSILELNMASKLLKDGELVAIPTETVYGLGANALDKNACLNIFKAKGRPGDNPLIVHIARPSDAEKIAYTNELYYELAKKFMPGPLTVIMPKREIIPHEVTAGLETVAVRCPVHKVANKLIEISGIPIAAPSANTSGKPSPTTAKHVYDDMNGKIPMILDGGECDVGVESTVISITDDSIVLLRPGAVTTEMLSSVCKNVTVANAVKEELKQGETALSPGMKYKHYAPKANLYLINDKNIFKANSFIKCLFGQGRRITSATTCAFLKRFCNFFTVGVVFHFFGAYLRIVKNGTVCINYGETEYR